MVNLPLIRFASALTDALTINATPQRYDSMVALVMAAVENAGKEQPSYVANGSITELMHEPLVKALQSALHLYSSGVIEQYAETTKAADRRKYLHQQKID